jgi:large subunit ribosomal protein L23
MSAIIERPILTEKMTMLGTKRQYAFRVRLDSNKIEVARAIEKRFNVKVTSIRTLKNKGKLKTQLTKRGRFAGRRPTWKKAIVTLAEGQSIELLNVA